MNHDDGIPRDTVHGPGGRREGHYDARYDARYDADPGADPGAGHDGGYAGYDASHGAPRQGGRRPGGRHPGGPHGGGPRRLPQRGGRRPDDDRRGGLPRWMAVAALGSAAVVTIAGAGYALTRPSDSPSGSTAGAADLPGQPATDTTVSPGASPEATPTPTTSASPTAKPKAKPKPVRKATPTRKPSRTSSPGSGARPPSSGGSVPSTSAGQVVSLTNAERARKGCGPVTIDSRLQTAAQRHSADMVARDYFSHSSPDGKGPGDRITAAGYRWSTYGENIAAGQPTPASVVSAWMNSSGHRANILNCSFKNIGVGLARKGGTPYWTQVFGAR
ncbi:CAP domain-containing protein [Spirillospora sp. NPDC047279]|uniref:CAP domain-containing protein n=1 Tax=Spirillospora sp. NPDC047279 TaxID=3155478 RepID=UPI003402CFE3